MSAAWRARKHDEELKDDEELEDDAELKELEDDEELQDDKEPPSRPPIGRDGNALWLTKGIRVMHTANLPDGRLCNGSMGMVTAWQVPTSACVYPVLPVVHWNNGRTD